MSGRAGASRRWPAYVAPFMGALHDLVLNLSQGRARVSLERLPEDPVLRVSLGGRRGLEELRDALLERLSEHGFEETGPGLWQRRGLASLALVGIGSAAADAETGLPAFELWGLDGLPAEADPRTVSKPEALS